MSNITFHSSQVKLQPFCQCLHKEVGYHPWRWLSKKVTEILKTGKSTNPWCQGSLILVEVSVSEELRDPQDHSEILHLPPDAGKLQAG